MNHTPDGGIKCLVNQRKCNRLRKEELDCTLRLNIKIILSNSVLRTLPGREKAAREKINGEIEKKRFRIQHVLKITFVNHSALSKIILPMYGSTVIRLF
jgi:NOL1/NOP2/fmu family ribosome biogenesis protein